MSVLSIVENWDSEFKKISFETISYAKKIANQLDVKLTTISFGSNKPEILQDYGADTIINITNVQLESLSNIEIAQRTAQLINQYDIQLIIISNTNTGKSLSPLLANILQAGLISNAVQHPDSLNPVTVTCKAFSGKALAQYQSIYSKNIITILPNSIGEIIKSSGDGEVNNIEQDFDNSSIELKIKERTKSTEKISLQDADIIVSAGRGLKDKENWKMVEELAELLGAATACSKPVSDMGWRPHSEHVGQTGIAVNPQLYIAIGISGAIQHLAGVSSSKNIVVINTDPEAPFFKSAHYGVIGDAFKVVPDLIQAIKQHNN